MSSPYAFMTIIDPARKAQEAYKFLENPGRFIQIFSEQPDPREPGLKPVGIQKTLDILSAAITQAGIDLTKRNSLNIFFQYPVSHLRNPFGNLSNELMCHQTAKSRLEQPNWSAAGGALLVTALYIAGAAAMVLAVQLAVSSIFYMMTGNVLGFAVASNASIAIDSFLVTSVAKKVAIYVFAALASGYMINSIANDQYKIAYQTHPENFAKKVTKFFRAFYLPVVNAYDRVRIGLIQKNQAKCRAGVSADTIKCLGLELKRKGALEGAMTAIQTEISSRSPAMKLINLKALNKYDVNELKAAYLALREFKDMSTAWGSAEDAVGKDTPHSVAYHLVHNIRTQPQNYPFGYRLPPSEQAADPNTPPPTSSKRKSVSFKLPPPEAV